MAVFPFPFKLNGLDTVQDFFERYRSRFAHLRIGPFWLRLVSKMTEFINDHLAIAVSKMTILSRIWLKIAVSGSILYQNNNLYDSLPFQT